MKLVGRIPKSAIAGGELVRMKYPPFDVLVTMEDGEPTAIEDACNHAGASLAAGDRSDFRPHCVVCPLHGYVFDLRTGAIVIPQGLCDDQRKFVCTTEGDDVVVWDPLEVKILGIPRDE
ncbi:MAG TPA: Rieske (2Fe-2S) protein [Polyangiaceae bacterium]|jgi:nitrite reductase/ring-hydroxylating ferredoxin subunit